ncbi:MAG: pilus assembly protein [Pseudolabrys sp.]|nr:pilus assembly protein [Pseudolabrys sp.]
MHGTFSKLPGLARAFAGFGRARDGAVVVIFALAIIPVLGLVGAAVDFSRANSLKATMQNALDATALMLSKTAASQTSAQLQVSARSYFLAQFTRPEAKNAAISVSYSKTGGSTVVVNGSADIDTEFMGILGLKSINITGTATSKWGSTRLRVALVLDITGSMDADGKMAALKTSTKNLLSQLKDSASVNGDVYVSMVPFARSVNVGASNYNANWIDWSEWEAEPAIMATWLATTANKTTWEQTGPGSSCPFTAAQHGFTCVATPIDGAASTTTIPSSGTYSGGISPSADGGNKDSTKAGFYYPGYYNSVAATRTISTGSSASCGSSVNCTCSGGGSNKVCTQKYFTHTWVKNARSTWTGCVADRGALAAPGTNAGNDQTATVPSTTDITTRYPARQDSYCSSAAIGLNYNWSTMNSAVDALDANGGTNQPIGLVMGWHSLVGIGPFTAPPKDSNYTYTDVIILMSDGLNTWDRWYGNGSATNTSVDNRMLDSTGKGTCANIKNSKVTLYTIHVNTGGDPLSTLLRNCAGSPDKFSDPEKFFSVTTASGLGTVFTAIGTNLTKLRIAQ